MAQWGPEPPEQAPVAMGNVPTISLSYGVCKDSTVDVGDKVKKLSTNYMKCMERISTIFMEAGKHIELETFPKKDPGIKTFLDYEVHEAFKNISLILHVMSPISYHEFKFPMMLWPIQNAYYMTKIIFKAPKIQ
eukprot:10762504-Ditylum_brightwellii.AAC.1